MCPNISAPTCWDKWLLTVNVSIAMKTLSCLAIMNVSKLQLLKIKVHQREEYSSLILCQGNVLLWASCYTVCYDIHTMIDLGIVVKFYFAIFQLHFGNLLQATVIHYTCMWEVVSDWAIPTIVKITKPDWGIKTILERAQCASVTVVMLGTSEGTPEPPCLGTAVPERHCTWIPPARQSDQEEMHTYNIHFLQSFLQQHVRWSSH